MSRSTNIIWGIAIGALAAGALSGTAAAAPTPFDDRPTWLTAIGGAPDATEDFEGFVADTEFRTQTVALAVGTIEQIGTDENFRNLVEVPPLQFTDNNGTSHASCFTNAAEPPGNPLGTTVELTFSSPVSAWGADFTGVLGGEFLAVALDADGSIIGTLTPTSQDQFLGFAAGPGESVTKVILSSQNITPGGGGRGFQYG